MPRDLVDEAVAVCGVRARHSDGKLPAHVVTYLTLALSLFPDDDYREVATKVTGSLDRWGCWNAAWRVPTTSAISQARKRLGREVLPELFERCCGPVAGTVGPTAEVTALGTARGAFLRRWRLLAIDGAGGGCWPSMGSTSTCPTAPRTPTEFGYAGSGENRSAFPKARVVALAECGTRAFVAAEVDAYSVGRRPWPSGCIRRLRGDELLTADRGFYSWQAWDTATARGRAAVARPDPAGSSRGAGARRDPQLASIKWTVDSRGRIKIESKDDMRQRGLPSPDRADTLAMVMSRRATGGLKVDIYSHPGESITGDLMQRAW